MSYDRIDKRDSVELAEAINSMYQWYRNSKICGVYLEDVPQKQLIDSEWFDRGWTLQELIAPKKSPSSITIEISSERRPTFFQVYLRRPKSPKIS